MNAMTTISEAAAVAISEAGRTSTPAEAKADPARSLRRLIIPLAAVGAAAALVLVTSARWNAWVGAAAVQTTDNAAVHAETTRLSARVSGNVRHVAVKSFQRV
jgi:membrane fusion protein, multidrug efflux system